MTGPAPVSALPVATELTGNLEAPAGEASAPPAAPMVAASSSVRLPVDARGIALGLLATVAVIFALEWAQSLVISLLLGILFAYTLNPLVAALEKIHVPRALGTCVVMISVVGTLLFGAYSLRGQVQTIISQLPVAAGKLSAGLDTMRERQLENMRNVQRAARAMEKAANPAASALPGVKQRGMHVIVDPPTFQLENLIVAGSKGIFIFLGQAAMVIFLVFFLLIAGDTFKRKLVRLTGPSLSKRKITVHILDDINGSIQRYMFMLLLTNSLLACLTWIAFRWIGLENAGVWAVAAGLLHVIPYFGPVLTAGATGMAAFMQYETFSAALMVAGVSLAIATVVGIFVTTWMAGRIAKMNTAAVFISLLFWGWLWGVWGMLLSIPIIVIVKVVSQHVEQLHPVAELLGE